jgi:hypothetical protein
LIHDDLSHTLALFGAERGEFAGATTGNQPVDASLNGTLDQLTQASFVNLGTVRGEWGQ